MSDFIEFNITPGLPFRRAVMATLPEVRDWWITTDDFEVLSQIRVDSKKESDLVLDLAQYLSISMTDADTVRIDLGMSGEETRELTRSGYGDIMISDPGTTDERAYVLVKFRAKRRNSVTKETVGAA